MILGIDPGKSGGIAFIHSVGLETINVSKHTPHDLVGFIENRIEHYGNPKCYIERVHSMPKQGVKSIFTFGQNFGTYIGILTALKIPFTYVSPGTWQRALGCLSKGNKNVTKRKAQELFPSLSITHATADAILIAEYGRRTEMKHTDPDSVDDL